MLGWGTGTTDNLLVRDANSPANLQLSNGATFTITGATNETFTIATGATLNVAVATDTI